jgi:histidinol-phosphate aminotransferase
MSNSRPLGNKVLPGGRRVWSEPVNQVKEHIERLEAYEPGLQPREGERAIKLNTNENPYPPSPWVEEAIREEGTDRLRLYPDPGSQRLRETAASLYGVPPEQVLCGNGSDEILGILLRTFTTGRDRIGYYVPSYSYYKTLGAIHNLDLIPTPLGEDPLDPPLPAQTDLRIFFLTNPNSPMGFALSPEFVARLAKQIQGILVVDEAYADFARWNCLSLIQDLPNVLITRSLSKSYSLAGLRVGFAVGAERWIEQMNKVRDHYNLNRIAQAAACVALRDQRHYQDNKDRVLRTRERFCRALGGLGLETFPSEANFVFAKLSSAKVASTVFQGLNEKGIYVRYFPQEGLDQGLRISVGTDGEMDLLLAELRILIERIHPESRARRKGQGP